MAHDDDDMVWEAINETKDEAHRVERDLSEKFGTLQLEMERRFSEQAHASQEMFQKALDAAPAAITQEREQEMADKERRWKRRERIYAFIVAIFTAWMAVGPDIERFFHHLQ